MNSRILDVHSMDGDRAIGRALPDVYRLEDRSAEIEAEHDAHRDAEAEASL